MGEELSCSSCQQNNHKILISHQACSRSLLGYSFVAVLILYMQDSSVKIGYHISKGININEKTLDSQHEI